MGFDENFTTLTGRLTSDPTEAKTTDGTTVKNMRIAVTSGKTTSFIPVEVFGGWADNFSGRKGDPVAVTGSILSDEWDDQKTGERRSRLVVKARQIRKLVKPPKAHKAEPQPERVSDGELTLSGAAA